MSAKILSVSARIAVGGLVLATSVIAQSDNEIAFVHVASPEQRLRYLATAQIWLDPGNVTPEMILAGRPLKESKPTFSGVPFTALRAFLFDAFSTSRAGDAVDPLKRLAHPR